MSKISFLFGMLLATAGIAGQLDIGRNAILSQQGCYIIDYSYVETDSLKEGYVKDNRVYDVNTKNTVKEFIYADEISGNRIRLQHILFAVNPQGQVMKEAMLKHQVEDWEYNAGYLYDFQSPQNWAVKNLDSNLWTRRVTNLDDGLRYQCASTWSEDKHYPEWSCSNYAPIPGRETRDMGRKDYNTLDRSTKVVAYGSNWLERQINVKTIYKDGVKTPLAREVGKNWYVRVSDEECVDAKAFASERREFWSILREVWDEVFDGKVAYVEPSNIGSKRYVEIMQLEAEYYQKDLLKEEVRLEVKNKIQEVIKKYRVQ